MERRPNQRKIRLIGFHFSLLHAVVYFEFVKRNIGIDYDVGRTISSCFPAFSFRPSSFGHGRIVFGLPSAVDATTNKLEYNIVIYLLYVNVARVLR